MARRTLSPRDLQAIQALAARWGQIVARHAFGSDGPDTDIDLTAMEQVAAAAAAGLVQGTLTTLLEQQAQRLGAQQPCPACGRLCAVAFEDRTLLVQGGHPVTHREPVCHCPDCRRDFFPPTDPAAPGQPPVQPRRPADDR